MKNIFLNIFLLSLFFLFLENQSLAHEWQSLESGLSYAKVKVLNNKSSVTLHVLKINPGKFNIKPILVKDTRTVRQMAHKSGALAVANANFFDVKDRPLGLVVIDAQQIQAKKDISWWGIFCLKNGRASILRSLDYRTGLCEQAVQAGPRLVINGWIPKLKEESSRKTAIGITRRNEVILAVSVENIPITKLAQVFREPEHRGGLETLHALNLDGGTSSQLYINTGKFRVNLPNFIAVPVGIGVFSK